MDKQKAESFITRLSAKQTEGIYPCPRCGRNNMTVPVTRNALSRCYNIHICDMCGMDEALRAITSSNIPPVAWDVAINPERYDLMNRYYFTFGDDPQLPYQNAWLEVVASSWDEATALFRETVPNKVSGDLNCSFCYDETKWKQLDPPLHWVGYECVGVLTREEFLPI